MPKMKKVLSASIAASIIEAESKLCAKLKLENFIDKDVSTIYNPLLYASAPHNNYLNKWCNSPRDIMFLGMNPGPFGMCQNGVPFGEIETVKNWLKIEGKVNKPEKEDPNRPIEGMNVKKREVSGQRLWGLFKEVSKEPEVLFKNCIVFNFIPLCFIGKSGKNIAPDQLKPALRKKLIKLCGDSLCEIIDILQIKIVVCVGKWTEQCLHEIKKESKLSIEVLGIMHPSPLNRKANKDYIGIVKNDLEKLGVLKYLIPDENFKSNSTGTPDKKTLEFYFKKNDANLNESKDINKSSDSDASIEDKKIF